MYKIKDKMKPTKTFLEKLKGDEIKVFYEAHDPSFSEGPMLAFFKGKLIDFDDKQIAVESDTDYKIIALVIIENLFSLTKTRKCVGVDCGIDE